MNGWNKCHKMLYRVKSLNYNKITNFERLRCRKLDTLLDSRLWVEKIRKKMLLDFPMSCGIMN